MGYWIVERNCAIKMFSAACRVATKQQRQAHEAMRDQERRCRLLLRGKLHELHRRFAHYVPVECHKVRSPEAVEDREQQHWVFEGLSERLRLLYQRTRPLRSQLSLRCRVSFDVD
jgi:hypothetical protein